MDNKNLVSGSAALAPKRKPYYPSKDEELQRKKKEEEQKRKALIQKRSAQKAKSIKIIAAAFIIGVVLIMRYSSVYNLQKDLINLKTDMQEMNMENENLKVALIKASNIEQIEATAKSKLHMVVPNKNNVVYEETTKDYFANSTDESKQEAKESVLTKIKNMLF
jgi:cell division protein FtsL